MIRRTLDPTFLNSIANHPDVLPWLGAPDGPVDVSPLVEAIQNIAIEGPAGGWILVHLEPGVYELHTMFLPEGRGKSYLAASKEALRYVFVHTDATEILTKCPDTNGAARMAAATAGFRERFRRDGVWTDGSGVSYQGFTIEDWRQRDREVLKAGKWFHTRLDELISHEAHPEDEAHDRAVGSAVLMARAGALSKGIAFYNRWARFAGYVEARQIGPSAVDFGEAVVELINNDMSVLVHRQAQG